MGKINFVSGGKTGDLLHNLMVVKSMCETQNKKAVLYITNVSSYGGDNFHFDMHKTYNDLEPIIMSQPYIDSFHLLRNDDVIDDFINLNQWRESELLHKSNWINLLCNKFKINPPSEPWLTYNKKEGLDDAILIHRSLHRHIINFPWEKIVNENKCYFITNTCALHEYEQFQYKDKVELISCETLSDLVISINSCKFFIGNMSTPLALAHCLGKPHLGELIFPDEFHYIGEEKYIKDYFYINDNNISYLNGITKFINL
jgi:hypothetical protein